MLITKPTKMIISNNERCLQIFFYPELEPFFDETQPKKELPENFDKLRKIGLNTTQFAQLIRDDNLEGFNDLLETKHISK